MEEGRRKMEEGRWKKEEKKKESNMNKVAVRSCTEIRVLKTCANPSALSYAVSETPDKTYGLLSSSHTRTHTTHTHTHTHTYTTHKVRRSYRSQTHIQ